ncbi:hypothetical protein FOL46_003610 [Perkinsus olseni]|uniref:EF-hand domain-containing protein n=1 Tax=Perkinsus olseni TaxID=32597 RepID=A0A7J6MTF9_PEROL|nr:hypothetical protein FOL46_003610 [Perkinsus olseni]
MTIRRPGATTSVAGGTQAGDAGAAEGTIETAFHEVDDSGLGYLNTGGVLRACEAIMGDYPALNLAVNVPRALQEAGCEEDARQGKVDLAAFYRIFDRLDEILEREASEELRALRHSPQPAKRKSLWSTLVAALTNVIRRAFRSGGDHRVSAQHQENKASREASSTAWGGQRVEESRDGCSRTADLLEKLLVELQRIRSILEGKVINRNIVIDAHDGTDASTVEKAQGCCEVTGHRACNATTEQGAIVAVEKSNSEDRLGDAAEAKSSSSCHVDVESCNLTVVFATRQ